MSNILIILLISHFMGDYYLQSKKSVEKKENNFRYVLLHGLYYMIPCAVFLLLYWNINLIPYFIAFGLSHLCIDSLKYIILKKHNGQREVNKDKKILKVNNIYFADQIFHLMAIIIISMVYLSKNADITIIGAVSRYTNATQEEIYKTIKVLLLFVIILRPVSITFYELFDVNVLTDDKKNVSERDEVQGAGELIGYLERIVMIILLILGEYAAIGLVIAGKSIIRFSSNIKTEFFIIGTFYGIITSIVPYILIWLI